MATRAILILGGDDQFDTELQRHAWPAGVEALDITDEAAISAAIAERPYAAVISAAAYTAVDRAESEVAAAWRLNARAPDILAAATAKAGIPVVHVSTDCVIDGSGKGSYATDAPIHPTSVYGASKAAGEMAVRTVWVVSSHRANFVKTMLRLASERDTLTVVADQRGCPTTAGALAAIALRLAEDPLAPTGTYHCVNAGATTWYNFAHAIMAGARARGARAVPLEPILSSVFPAPAKRSANSGLSTQTLRRDFGLTPRPWQAALDDILDALVGTAAPAWGDYL